MRDPELGVDRVARIGGVDRATEELLGDELIRGAEEYDLELDGALRMELREGEPRDEDMR